MTIRAPTVGGEVDSQVGGVSWGRGMGAGKRLQSIAARMVGEGLIRFISGF